jgi:hypothetical protein
MGCCCPKALSKGRAVSYFYETEFEIRDISEPANSTENFCNFAKAPYF